MKKEDYEDLLEEMSEQLAERIMEKEENLAKRALQLDGDIAKQLRTLGQKASEKILGKIRDELVEKKSPKD
jgi:C4-dicarboxylate-specific signal transduction histidine kinase